MKEQYLQMVDEVAFFLGESVDKSNAVFVSKFIDTLYSIREVIKGNDEGCEEILAEEAMEIVYHIGAGIKPENAVDAANAISNLHVLQKILGE